MRNEKMPYKQFGKMWNSRFNKLEAVMKSHNIQKDSREQKIDRARKEFRKQQNLQSALCIHDCQPGQHIFERK